MRVLRIYYKIQQTDANLSHELRNSKHTQVTPVYVFLSFTDKITVNTRYTTEAPDVFR